MFSWRFRLNVIIFNLLLVVLVLQSLKSLFSLNNVITWGEIIVSPEQCIYLRDNVKLTALYNAFILLGSISAVLFEPAILPEKTGIRIWAKNNYFAYSRLSVSWITDKFTLTSALMCLIFKSSTIRLYKQHLFGYNFYWRSQWCLAFLLQRDS